jgi:Tyrosine-protein kinase ephrin type A/B receptor-like
VTLFRCADCRDLSAAAVCLGGYGSYAAATTPTCSACAADTYGPKGSTAACTQCPDGGVAAPKSDGAGDCYAAWQNLQKDYDYLPVQSASLMSDGPTTATTDALCQAACDTTDGCAFYQFDSASSKCSLYIAPAASGTVEVGFKIDTGVYSVIAGTTDSSNIGVTIAAPASASVRNCVHECDKVEGCVAVVITNEGSGVYRCGMKQGALSADIQSKYKVAGAKIGAWSV